MNEDKAREAFETRCSSYINCSRKDSGEYVDVFTESEWQKFKDGWTTALQWAASQQAAEGWRPIESAPKDGTDVLVMYVYIDTQVVHNAFYASETEGWEAQDAGWWSYEHSEVSRIKLDDWMTPTHWMPLPAPPSTQGGADA